MVGVTTVALIDRRRDISRDLFSRYWRDVHGVMAVRIPGFASYTQYHVTPASIHSPPFEGIAIVTFAKEDDRQGLATSEVTQHIHRDEQNVFRRALLYNLDGASRRVGSPGDRHGPHSLFVVGRDGDDPAACCRDLAVHCSDFCDIYDLRSGDPAKWNQTDVSGQRFAFVIHAGWQTAKSVEAAIATADARMGIYRLDEAHVMVEDGFPTAVGLRGLDAARTIAEASADNQLSHVVVRAIYGAGMAPETVSASAVR